jgi:hypothetical protein
MNDTDAGLWHPWLRINRVLRVMLHTRWSAEASTILFALVVVVLDFPGAVSLAAEPDAAEPPAFFDPLAAIAPGITREVALLVDHIRSDEDRLTQLSIKLQLPVQSWLQFSLEMPVVFLEPHDESTRIGAGDLVLVGQAMAWAPRAWPAEIDVGLELTLPTGNSNVLTGSLALRPFAAAGTKLGPFDVIGNLSYQWVLDGPAAYSELFQATVAGAYRVRWLAPFVEVVLLKGVRGLDDLRPQVSVLPGVELFLPWNLSISAGVQLPLGPAKFFDQRVLGLVKWSF